MTQKKKTTITMSEETKARLYEMKKMHETWDKLLNRIISQSQKIQE